LERVEKRKFDFVKRILGKPEEGGRGNISWLA
jgi:hypothetical protein